METVLKTNYVMPGSIPVAASNVQASPGAAAAGPEAEFRMWNQLGASTEHMASGLNEMLGQEKHAELRDAWRAQRMDEKAQKEADRQQKLQDTLYVQSSSIQAQMQLNQAHADAYKTATPGGDLAGDVVKGDMAIMKPYIDDAPTPEAAQRMAIHIGQHLPAAQHWALGQQQNINNQAAISSLGTDAQSMAADASRNPSSASDLVEQYKQKGETLKQLVGPNPHIDAHIQSGTVAIQKSAMFSLADNNPVDAQNKLMSGEFDDFLGKEPAFKTQLQRRIDSSFKSTFSKAEYGVQNIIDSTTIGMQPPTDANDKLQSALSVVNTYGGGKDDVRAQKLLAKVETASRLMKYQQALIGSTPEMVNNVKLGIAAAEKQMTGDPAAIETHQGVKKLIATREELFKHSPMDVEIADGTVKAPSVGLGANLNNDPQALAQFTDERTKIQGVLEGHNYRDKHGNPNTSPFTKEEVQDFSNKVGNLDPISKLEALQFTNQMPEKLAAPLLKKVSDKTDPENAMGLAIKLMPYEPRLAKDIAMGHSYISGDSKLVEKGKLKDVTAALQANLGGLFQDDPKLMHQYMGASQALLASQTMKNGTSYADGILNNQDLQSSFARTLGIESMKAADGSFFGKSYQTIMPYVPVAEARTPDDRSDKAQYRRMTKDEFVKTVDGIKDHSTLETYGNGLPIDGTTGKTIDLAKSNLSLFKWIPVGQDGSYELHTPGKGGDRVMVNDHDGSHFIFNMKKYLADHG